MPTNAETRTGLFAAMGAYALWGFLPLYFKLLGDTSPTVILAHRIVWSVPTALILIIAAGKLGDLAALRRNRGMLLGLLASSLAIACNWTIYIWAVTHNRVLEGSLGYFINPLVTFLFAAMFFGERFRPLQLVALGIATLGVINQAVVVGQFPWISLSLAVSFAIYGAIRKKIPVDSRVGFAMEALWLAPVAAIYLFFIPHTPSVWGDGSTGLVLLFLLAGPFTAAPLILFALGARRLKLSTIGVLQYIGPTLQFVIALALGEHFTPAHAVTFGLIWLGVIIFTVSARSTPAAVAPAAVVPPAAAAAPSAD